jgi:DNA-binding response OmpR family regulator
MALEDSLVKPIVVIDDDAERARAIGAGLRDRGYSVMEYADTVAGLIAIEDHGPLAVIVAWHVTDQRDGWVINSEIVIRSIQRALQEPPPVIALVETAEDADRVQRLGARACVGRPPDSQQLIGMLCDILRELHVEPPEPSNGDQ